MFTLYAADGARGRDDADLAKLKKLYLTREKPGAHVVGSDGIVAFQGESTRSQMASWRQRWLNGTHPHQGVGAGEPPPAPLSPAQAPPERPKRGRPPRSPSKPSPAPKRARAVTPAEGEEALRLVDELVNRYGSLASANRVTGIGLATFSRIRARRKVSAITMEQLTRAVADAPTAAPKTEHVAAPPETLRQWAEAVVAHHGSQIAAMRATRISSGTYRKLVAGERTELRRDTQYRLEMAWRATLETKPVAPAGGYAIDLTRLMRLAEVAGASDHLRVYSTAEGIGLRLMHDASELSAPSVMELWNQLVARAQAKYEQLQAKLQEFGAALDALSVPRK